MVGRGVSTVGWGGRPWRRRADVLGATQVHFSFENDQKNQLRELHIMGVGSQSLKDLGEIGRVFSAPHQPALLVGGKQIFLFPESFWRAWLSIYFSKMRRLSWLASMMMGAESRHQGAPATSS